MYHPPTEGQFDRFVELKGHFLSLAGKIMEMCPESVEREEAIRTLQKASMIAVLSISVNEN
jgi:hypothetical protein